MLEWYRKVLRQRQITRRRVILPKLPRYLSLKKTSEVLGVHPNTLRRWDASGKLSALRYGSRHDRRFRREDIEHALRSNWFTAASIGVKRKQQRWPAYALAATAIVAVIVRLALPAPAAVEAESAKAKLFLEPEQCNGWQLPDRATSIDVLEHASATDFTSKTAAVFQNTATAGNEALDAVDRAIVCQGFDQDLKRTAALKFVGDLTVSLAAVSDGASEDVLTFSYSLDGQTWQLLDSLVVDQGTSNAAADGYRRFALPDLSPTDLSQLRIKTEYHPGTETGSAAAYLDGVALALQVVVATDEAESKKLLTTAKGTFSGGEEPVISVEIQKSSVIGILGSSAERTVRSVRLTDPLGETIDPTIIGQDRPAGRSLLRDLTLARTNFSKPGKYTLTVEIEEGGEIKTLTQEFYWGVLVMNTEKAEYRPAETAHVGMGVLDEGGHTICDATLTLRVTSPQGRVTTFSTDAETITRSTECGPVTVTNTPDYSADVPLAGSGDYQTELVAVTAAGEFTVTGTIFVKDEPAITVTRHAPSRIWPLATYTVLLEFTPAEDYFGAVNEAVPVSFNISDIDAGGEATSDDTTQTISWRVDWQAGQTYALGYVFDAPDISPELFLLGPLTLPDYLPVGMTALDQAIGWTEPRQWQIASDSTGSGAPTRLWMTGFENNTTTAGKEYTANINTPTIVTSPVRTGTYALRANPTTSTAGFGYRFSNADSAVGTYFRTYIQFATSSLPSVTTDIVEIRDAAGTAQAAVQYDATNARLLLCNIEDDASCAAPIGNSANSSITTGTWYRIEVYVDFGTAATGDTKLKGQLDGSEFATSTTVNWANGVRDLYSGILTTNASADMFVDDVAINADSSTSIAGEGYPGAGSIIYIRPDGNGSTANWTANLLCAAADYTCVNEVTPDDATTAVGCNLLTNEDYTLSNPTSNGVNVNDAIKVVQLNVRQGGATNGNSHTYSAVLGRTGETIFDTQQAIALATAGTYFTNDDTAPQNAPTTVDATGEVTAGQVSYDLPGGTTDTTDPWTPTALDGAYVRLGSTDCAPVTYISTVWVEVEFVPAEGGRLWSSGFELQSTTADMEYTANVNTPTISTTTFRSGLAALRANPSASTQGMSYNFLTADSSNNFYFRSYIRFTTLPDANTLLMAIRDNAGTNQASIRYDNTNHTLELWNEEDTAQIGSDSAEVTTGVWYRVEMRVDFGTAATGDTNVEGQLDGTSFASASNVNWANGVQTLQLGIITTSATADVFFDDVAINKNAGSTQNGYPGAGSIVYLRPNAAGDNDAWTKGSGTGCTTNSFDCVDDVTPNDFGSNDYVTSTTLNNTSDWNLTAATGTVPTSSTITLVQTGIRFNDSDTTVSSAKVRLKDAASANPIESYYILTNSTTAFTNNNTAPYTYPITAYTRPNLTTAWTIADLDSAQLGVRLGNDGGTNTYQVSAMWLLVEYSPPTITVSGTCKQYDQSTDCTNDTSNAIRIAVNGTLQPRADATADGAWSIPEVTKPANGDVITTFIDANADANEAVAVTVYDGSGDSTGITLFQKHLSLGSVDNPTVTNANISQYDNSVSGDEDIFDEVDAGNDLVVDSVASYTDEELYVASGATFQPASAGGADVTTVHVELVGIWTADSNLINVAGNWVNSGTFTAGTSTLTFNGTVAQGFTTNAQVYNNVTLNNTGTDGANDNVTITGALDVNATFNVTNGDLILNSGNPNVNTAGDATIGAAAFVTKGSGTWTFDGSAQNWSDASAGQDIGLVTVNGAPTTVTLTGSVTATKVDVTASDTLALASSGFTVTLTGTGTAAARPFIVSGALTEGTNSTVKFTGGGATTSEVQNETYDKLDISPGSNGSTWRLGTAISQTVATAGNFTLGNGTNTFTLDWALYDPILNVGGGLTLASGVTWTKSDSPATLTFNGATTPVTITDNNTTKQDLGTVAIDGTTKTANLGSSVTVTKITVGADDVLGLASSGFTLKLTGSGQGASKPFTITAGGALTEGTSSTVEYAGATATDVTTETYFNLSVKPGAAAITHHAESGSLNVSGLLTVGDGTNTGTFNLDTADPTTTVTGGVTIAASGTLVASAVNGLNVGGNWSNSGTFTATTGSTVTFNGAAAQTVTHASQSFYNMTLNNTGADGTTDDVTPSSGTLDVNNTLAITNGDLKLNTNSPNLTVVGNVTIGASAFVTKGTGTWTFDGLTAATYTDSTATPQNIGAVTFNKTDTVAPATNNKVTLASSLTTDTVTIDGTATQVDTLDLAAAGYTLTLANAGATANVLTINAGATLTIGTSTIKYTATNSAANINVNLLAYSSLEVAGTETYDLTGHQTGGNAITANLTIGSGATLDATATNYNIALSGNWSNSGTFTANTGLVQFTASDTGNTISGTLNGTSAFYKMDFDDPSGSDATWTIQNPIKVGATGLTNSVIVNDGTVTLGNGDNDDMELLGGMLVTDAAGEVGVFQTYTGLDQTLNEEIIIDVNNNASPVSCANCGITVGINNVSGSGSLKIAKNVVLRLNPYTAVPTDTFIKTLSNGYLEVKGTQDATGTSTATDSDALQEQKTCVTDTFVSANDVHNSKVLRFTSGLAYGRLFNVDDTINADINCATDTHDSLVRTPTDSADSTISGTPTTIGPMRRVCAAGAGMITADNEGIGRYLRDQDGADTFFLIIDSTNNNATNCSSNDSFIIWNTPDSYSGLASGETIDISDGVKPGDTFEVLDYAAVTAEGGTACSASPAGTAEGYIYASLGSKTLIQYALICDLGRNTSTTYGLQFASVDGSFTPNDGIDVRNSQIKDLLRFHISDSDNNSSANSFGVRDNDISENDYYVALVLGSSSDNNYIANNRIHNNGQGGIGCIFGSCGQNNAITSNYVYSNGSGGGSGMEFYDNNNTFTSNYSWANSAYGLYINDNFNTITSNFFFGNNTSGGLYLNGKNNTATSNTIIENGGRALNVIGAGNAIESNTLTSIAAPFRLETAGRNLLRNNTIYTDGSQQNWLQDSIGNVFSRNDFDGDGSGSNNHGIYFNSTGGSGASNNVSVGNTYDGLFAGVSTQGTVADTSNRFINDQFGVSTANPGADIDPRGSAQAHTFYLYNTNLASADEVEGTVATTGSFIKALKDDQTSGRSRVWGEYASVVDITETPQNEGIEQYNYANALYVDSVTPHSYTIGAGAGTEDTNLEFAFSGGSLGGDSSDFVYRVYCNPTANCSTEASKWDVYRNGTLLTAKADTDTLYTDTQNDGATPPNVQFKIDDGVTDFTKGATYLFVAHKTSNDANAKKTIYMEQDGDIYTNTASTTLQLKGQSYQTNTTDITRTSAGGYQFAINGTIDADNYSFQFLGGTAQASGLDINTGATVTSLARGQFSNFATNVSAADAFIDVDSSVIGASTPSLTIPNTTFTNGNSNASCNVNATGTDLGGHWEFTKQIGPFGGESNDCDDGAADPDPGQIKWSPPTISFTINDVAIGFSTLSSAAARWATGDANGSSTVTSAHTLAVSTNGDYGYILSYLSPTTLTSGANTITAATISGFENGSPGSEQFAFGLITNGSSTIVAEYAKGSNNYKFSAGATTTIVSRSNETSLETLTAYYIGNIAAVTEAGSYSTTITYIVTGSF